MIPPITPVKPAPTLEQIEQARIAKLDAWIAWAASGQGCNGHLWEKYMGAIERHAKLQFERNQAIENEVIKCLS